MSRCLRLESAFKLIITTFYFLTGHRTPSCRVFAADGGEVDFLPLVPSSRSQTVVCGHRGRAPQLLTAEEDRTVSPREGKKALALFSPAGVDTFPGDSRHKAR